MGVRVHTQAAVMDSCGKGVGHSTPGLLGLASAMLPSFEKAAFACCQPAFHASCVVPFRWQATNITDLMEFQDSAAVPQKDIPNLNYYFLAAF